MHLMFTIPAALCNAARTFCITLALVASSFAFAQAQSDPAASAQTIVHMLDYVGIDYPGAVEAGKIKNEDEFKEMAEFTAQVTVLLKSLPANQRQAVLIADAEKLVRLVQAKASAPQIAAAAGELRWHVIAAYNVPVRPKTAPDLKRGAVLYAGQCAACHGAQGKGDGPLAKGLEPPPSNFHDLERMAQRSVYGLYNTITLGVAGTGMASFSQLSEEDRWALAFFVANFAADDATRARGAALWTGGKGRNEFPDLANVATLSANEVKTRFGDGGMALQTYLRANPQALVATKPAPIAFAIATLGKSLDVYRNGKRAEATQLAIQAYLEGYDLIEASLQHIDAELMVRTEREMMAYRGLLQSSAPLGQVERQAAAVQTLLAEVREKLGSTQLSQATTFVSALVILLREGVEAILVIAAILAFLTRAGRADARRWVHAGWIAALALGGLTWVISGYLVEISGASREITEGVTALVAAAMLLYVGYWLHSKSHSAAWQKFIKAKVSGALSRGTLWTLVIVSFLAVYREAFETVLFYQALAAQAGSQSHGALLGGLALAAALLVALAWVILRASVRLPVGLFFSVSSIVLAILAVIFTGQGIAALQEAGKIGVDAVAFIAVPVLGIYPTAQTLAAQAAVILVIATGLWWAGCARRRLLRTTQEES